MLVGSYEVTLSTASRLRLPVEIVDVVGDHPIISRGAFGGLPLVSWARFDHDLAILLSQFDPRSAEARELKRFFHGMSTDLELTLSREIEINPRMEEHMMEAFVSQGWNAATLEKSRRKLTILRVGQRANVVPSIVWRALRERAAAGAFVDQILPSALRPGLPEEHAGMIGEIAIEQTLDTRERTRCRGTGRAFEFEVAEPLGASVDVVELTQAGGDSGIDLIVHASTVGVGHLLYVQCKSGRRVTVKEVRELIGVVARDGAGAGLLVAASGFTSGAEREARMSHIPVHTVQINDLAAWMDRTLSTVI